MLLLFLKKTENSNNAKLLVTQLVKKNNKIYYFVQYNDCYIKNVLFYLIQYLKLISKIMMINTLFEQTKKSITNQIRNTKQNPSYTMKI